MIHSLLSTAPAPSLILLNLKQHHPVLHCETKIGSILQIYSPSGSPPSSSSPSLAALSSTPPYTLFPSSCCLLLVSILQNFVLQ